MRLAVFIDGVSCEEPATCVPVTDRGLQYGDGLFETMRVIRGEVRFLDEHLDRLERGGARLALSLPARPVLVDELSSAAKRWTDAVLKLIVTRGDGPRGYRPPEPAAPRRILSIDETPVMNDGAPITVRWCSTQLGRNPALAGIKHLNRLEQVLARAEWSDVSIAEGLMLDTEGEIVCGTSCNVFAVIDGSLTTPDLRYCGVAGVMRRQVLSVAAALGIAVNEAPLRPDELARASEVFVTNAIAGIRPVGRLAELEWPIGATTRRLARALELW